MNCQDTQRLIHAYVDHELDLMTSLGLEAHLGECDACRTQHAGLRALRELEARHLRFHAAPDPLRTRINRTLDEACPRHARPRVQAWRAATAALAVALAALLTWTGVPYGPDGLRQIAVHSAEKMVYHIASSTDAETALRNVTNHLATSPGARIVVVAHNQGVDFLLHGAKDRTGAAYEPAVAQLAAHGVDFRVCQNTLARRAIGTAAVIPEARIVPSGIVEISRLQTQEGYAYMRL